MKIVSSMFLQKLKDAFFEEKRSHVIIEMFLTAVMKSLHFHRSSANMKSGPNCCLGNMDCNYADQQAADHFQVGLQEMDDIKYAS